MATQMATGNHQQIASHDELHGQPTSYSSPTTTSGQKASTALIPVLTLVTRRQVFTSKSCKQPVWKLRSSSHSEWVGAQYTMHGSLVWRRPDRLEVASRAVEIQAMELLCDLFDTVRPLKQLRFSHASSGLASSYSSSSPTYAPIPENADQVASLKYSIERNITALLWHL